MEIPRIHRKWWQKKTNWAIIVGVLGLIMPEIPAVAAYAPLVFKIAALFGLYGASDRAGEEEGIYMMSVLSYSSRASRSFSPSSAQLEEGKFSLRRFTSSRASRMFPASFMDCAAR